MRGQPRLSRVDRRHPVRKGEFKDVTRWVPIARIVCEGSLLCSSSPFPRVRGGEIPTSWMYDGGGSVTSAITRKDCPVRTIACGGPSSNNTEAYPGAPT